VSIDERDPGDTDLDPTSAATPSDPTSAATLSDPTTATTGRPLWVLFLGIAVGVLLVDQLSKAWVVASIAPTEAVHLLGDYLRLIYSRNDGALFGMFGSSAPILALSSLIVIGLVFVYHARSGRSPLLSIALGLLLGGALGNLIDRLHYGFVVDWVDMGVGAVRFWTFNLGDAAIDTGILLLIILALWPSVGGAAPDPGSGTADPGGTGPDA
jgi:signal peptidase II